MEKAVFRKGVGNIQRTSCEYLHRRRLEAYDELGICANISGPTPIYIRPLAQYAHPICTSLLWIVYSWDFREIPILNVNHYLKTIFSFSHVRRCVSRFYYAIYVQCEEDIKYGLSKHKITNRNAWYSILTVELLITSKSKFLQIEPFAVTFIMLNLFFKVIN